MNIWSLLSFVAGLVYLYLGLHVLNLDSKSRLNRSFFYTTITVALWTFPIAFFYPATTKEEAELWFRIAVLGYGTGISFILYFAMILTGKDNWIKKPVTYLFLALPPLLFVTRVLAGGELTAHDFILKPFGWQGTPPQTNWYFAYLAYYIGYTVFSMWLVWQWGHKSKYKRERKQAEIVVGTLGVTLFLSFVNESLLPALGVDVIPKIPATLAAIWGIGLWYAIAKYRFMTLSTSLVTDKIVTRIVDLIFLLDENDLIIKINRQVEDILGYNEQELLGKPLVDLIVDKQLFQNKMTEMKDISNTGETLEVLCISADDKTVPVRIAGSVIRDRFDDIVGCVLVVRDMRQTRQLQNEIMERKNVEEALLNSYEKLIELDKVKTDFLSTVSHELRTPLTSILGFAKIIGRTLENRVLPAIEDTDQATQRIVEQLVENTEIIYSESQRLTSLINDLLDIAKMEAGKIDWNFQKIYLGDVVVRAGVATSALFDEKRVELGFDLGDDVLPVTADKDRITQVIINLISNAVKFTESGRVTCEVKNYGDEVRVTVSDTGIGINEKDFENIFDRFKQVGDTLTNKPQGTGLGLPICKQIIEHHGGRIWVESNIGTGSRFSFVLPVFKEPQMVEEWSDIEDEDGLVAEATI
ncbi:MAG: ATP-binding protein [Acidobacteriota bacterium]